MSLAELCERHGTDKRPSYHDYATIYEPLLAPLRAQPTVWILEIGVSAGKSLRVWEDYFPTARIIGLDREPKTHLETVRVSTAVCDQGERASVEAFLRRVALSMFDLVIDDGGHRMAEQQLSLGMLLPYVRPGGLYVIEDVHTSFPDLYPGYGVDPDGENTTYAMLDRFIRTGRVRSPYLTDAEARYLERHVAWASYHFRPGRLHSDLVVFRKR